MSQKQNSTKTRVGALLACLATGWTTTPSSNPEPSPPPATSGNWSLGALKGRAPESPAHARGGHTAWGSRAEGTLPCLLGPLWVPESRRRRGSIPVLGESPKSPQRGRDATLTHRPGMQSGHPVSPPSRGSTRRPTRCRTAGKGRGRVPQTPRPRAAVYLGRGPRRGRPAAPLPPPERWGSLPAQDAKSTPSGLTRPTNPHSVWSRAPGSGVRDSSPDPEDSSPSVSRLPQTLQKLRLPSVL